MQVNVSARHGQLSEDAQGMIRRKAAKLLKIFDRITAINVTVDLQKEVRNVEIQVEAEHKHDMIAKAQGREGVMGLVDQALQKLESQLRRYKEKIQSHRGTPSAGSTIEATPPSTSE